MTKSIISFENYSFRYDLRERLTILDVNATISEGEFVVVTGPSGCGKSTLCYSILGLIPHFYAGEVTGNVIFRNKNTKEMSISDLIDSIGYVPQRIENSFTTPYVISELAFPLEYRNYPKQKMIQTIEVIAKEIELEHLLYRTIDQLSEGEKQKVSIGSALVTNPEIIIADEPTSNLDKKNKAMILSVLQQLHNKGKTVIVSTHEYKNYTNFATRIIELDNGKIIKNKLVSEKEINIKNKKKDIFAKELQIKNESNSQREPIIEIENLSFEYPSHFTLSNLSLSLNKGEIVGIIGENGSGKTTLIKLLCGLLKRKSGAIRINNEDIEEKSWKKITREIGVVFQDPEIQFFEENLREEIAFIAKNLDKLVSDQDISEMLVNSNLLEYEFFNPHSLSHGEKRRLAFLSAINHNPDIILLDEINNGLGLKNKEWLINQLLELKKKKKTIVVITHDWEWLADFVDSVLSLDNGKISTKMNIEQFNNLVMNRNSIEVVK